MAAKKKAAPKGVKASKTTNAKSTLTARQNQVYRAVFKNALKSARTGNRANTIARHRLQAALARQKTRNRIISRTHAKIVRNTYLQASYGVQAGVASGVPLKSSLRKVASITAYLQAHYGFKTYAITTGQGSVRVKPRVKRGKIVAAGRRAVVKPKTNRSAVAAASAAARRVSPKAKAVSRPRKAARDIPAPDTQWITAGNDQGKENCVAVAIANSVLYQTGHRVSDEQVAVVRSQRINLALWRLWRDSYWLPVDLIGYTPQSPDLATPGDIIGFETGNGSHCGILLPGNMVVSWGEVIPLESPIDEAWSVKWKITG